MNKVEGRSGLIKDTQTNTVINDNKDEYENYKQTLKRNLELVQRVDKLEQELEELKAIVKAIGRTAGEAKRDASRFTTTY